MRIIFRSLEVGDALIVNSKAATHDQVNWNFRSFYKINSSQASKELSFSRDWCSVVNLVSHFTEMLRDFFSKNISKPPVIRIKKRFIVINIYKKINRHTKYWRIRKKNKTRFVLHRFWEGVWTKKIYPAILQTQMHTFRFLFFSYNLLIYFLVVSFCLCRLHSRDSSFYISHHCDIFTIQSCTDKPRGKIAL